MTVTVFTEDPDQIHRLVCDLCAHAYIAHPSNETDHQLRGYAVDHGWTCTATADICPPCSKLAVDF